MVLADYHTPLCWFRINGKFLGRAIRRRRQTAGSSAIKPPRNDKATLTT